MALSNVRYLMRNISQIWLKTVHIECTCYLIGTITFLPSAQRMSTAFRFSCFLMRLEAVTYGWNKLSYQYILSQAQAYVWERWFLHLPVIFHLVSPLIRLPADSKTVPLYEWITNFYQVGSWCTLCSWWCPRPPHEKATFKLKEKTQFYFASPLICSSNKNINSVWSPNTCPKC